MGEECYGLSDSSVGLGLLGGARRGTTGVRRRGGEKLSANVGFSGVRARGRLLQLFIVTLGQIILIVTNNNIATIHCKHTGALSRAVLAVNFQSVRAFTNSFEL